MWKLVSNEAMKTVAFLVNQPPVNCQKQELLNLKKRKVQCFPAVALNVASEYNFHNGELAAGCCLRYLDSIAP